MKPKIVVIGSSNTDMIINVPHLPSPGETVLGDEISIVQGGKGANQAVAAARAGGDVVFISCLGTDAFGNRSLEMLSQEGIDTSNVKLVSKIASGVALINVSRDGENSISVAPGANSHLLPEDITRLAGVIEKADMVLLQLEIPMDTVCKAIEVAVAQCVPVILNPAPAAAIDIELIKGVEVITPNLNEAAVISGLVDYRNNYVKMANALKNMGFKRVVITLGEEGAYYLMDGEEGKISGRKINAVDATAAGDTFNGYLAVALAKGSCMKHAIELANKAASISVTRPGAQPSIPYIKEIESLEEGKLK